MYSEVVLTGALYTAYAVWHVGSAARWIVSGLVHYIMNEEKEHHLAVMLHHLDFKLLQLLLSVCTVILSFKLLQSTTLSLSP